MSTTKCNTSPRIGAAKRRHAQRNSLASAYHTHNVKSRNIFKEAFGTKLERRNNVVAQGNQKSARMTFGLLSMLATVRSFFGRGRKG